MLLPTHKELHCTALSGTWINCICVYIYIYTYIYNTIYMYSGITSGRVLNGELLYTKILEVNLSYVPSSGEKSLRNSL